MSRLYARNVLIGVALLVATGVYADTDADAKKGCCLLRKTFPFATGNECSEGETQQSCAKLASDLGLPLHAWDFFPEEKCAKTTGCPSADAAAQKMVAQTLDLAEQGPFHVFNGRSRLSYDSEVGTYLGQGVDTGRSLLKVQSCVEVTPEIPPSRVIERSVFKSSRVTDEDTLTKTLNLSVSAAVRFAIAGGGVTTNFIHEVIKKASSDVYEAALDVKVSPPDFVKAPKIKDEYRSLPPLEFQRQCGDGYVHAIHYGGELKVYLRFDSLSREEKTQLENHGDGNYLAFSGSHKYTQTLRHLEQSSKLKMRYLKVGSPGGLVPTSLDEVKQAVSAFEKEVVEKPAPMTVFVVPYSELGVTTTGSIVDENYSRLATLILRLKTLYWLIRDIESNPQLFHISGDISPKTLSALSQRVKSDVELLRNALEACHSAGGVDCAFPARYSGMTEWEYRTQLPALRGGAADMEVHEANTNVARERKRLGDLEDLQKECETRRRCSSRNDLCTYHDKRCQTIHREIRKSERRLRQLEAAAPKIVTVWPEKMLRERLQRWIIDANDARCEVSDLEDCLNADQIDALDERIKKAYAASQPGAGG